MRAALALVASVVLLACSGGHDEESATTSAPARESSTSSSTTAPPDFTGDADSPFCTLLRDTDPNEVLAGQPGDPASVEAVFARLVGVMAQAAELAPPEIEADVVLVAAGVDALDQALAAVGYDMSALTATRAAEISAAVNDPAFADAGARLSAYRSEVCGL